MKIAFLLFPVLMVFASCQNHSGKHPAGTNGPSLTDMPPESTLVTYYKHLTGNINGEAATMDLLRRGTDYYGVYCFDSSTLPVRFQGRRNASELIHLEGFGADSAGGIFQGMFTTPIQFGGSWVRDSTEKQDTFDLEENYPSGSVQLTVHALRDSVKLFPGEKNSQQAVVNYSVLWPGKDFPDTVAKVVEDSILKTFLLENAKVTDPQAAIKLAADSFFVGYANVKNGLNKKSLKSSPVFNWESNISMEVLWNKQSLLSLEFDRYDYMGGAHGLENAFVKVFDLRHHRALSVADIFKPGYDTILRAALERQLRRQYHIPADEPLSGGEKGILFDRHISLTDNFYLTGKGIGFIYNPYEIAPYVYGRINLFIPFAELKEIMKDSFLNQ